MNEKHNFLIYTWLVIGILLFIGTFYLAWDSTEEYRSNLDQTQSSDASLIDTHLT